MLFVINITNNSSDRSQTFYDTRFIMGQVKGREKYREGDYGMACPYYDKDVFLGSNCNAGWQSEKVDPKKPCLLYAH